MAVARLCLSFAILAATPAVAQDYRALSEMRDAELATQAQAARRADVAAGNAAAVLDAQLRSDQALREIQAMQARPVLPQPVGPLSPDAAAAYVSIPDAKLAASNAAVRAASENRR